MVCGLADIGHDLDRSSMIRRMNKKLISPLSLERPQRVSPSFN